LPQHPVKDKDEEAPPKYFKKKVPLWNYLEGLESKLTVAHTPPTSLSSTYLGWLL